MKLPSRMQYLGVPDAVLLEIGSDLECCRRALEELSSAVIEACTNAMEHGNQLVDEKDIEIIFEIDDLEIKVTVLDHGQGFDFQGWQPPRELMRQRGRGILIMREFTDSMEFGRHADGRFLIRLTKVLNPSAETESASSGESS